MKVDTDAPAESFKWDAAGAEATSDTHLEDDVGHGGAAIIRQFIFSANPQTFKHNPPTKQQLFNHHLKQIEILLWQDGMKIMTNVEPRLTLNKKKTKYTIFVGATPSKGQLLPWNNQPKLLKDLVK